MTYTYQPPEERFRDDKPIGLWKPPAPKLRPGFGFEGRVCVNTFDTMCSADWRRGHKRAAVNLQTDLGALHLNDVPYADALLLIDAIGTERDTHARLRLEIIPVR